MPSVDSKPRPPEIDHRKAILSLRWLLIILASYLTLFTHVGTAEFGVVFGFAVVFSVSNAAFTFVPRLRFLEQRVQKGIAILDVVFVSATLYFLRTPDTYLYLAFLAVYLLAVVWRDLRLVLFSLFVVSVLFGVFNYLRLFRVELDLNLNVEQFLTMALFFVVSIFYVFLSERLTQDAVLSNTIFEEKRIAEVILEITGALSSSLNSDEVLFEF